MSNYLLKSPTNVEGYHQESSSLKMVMDKLTALAFPNCHTFIPCLKCFVQSVVDTMNNIMALTNHYGSRFPGQSKDKVSVLKMSLDIVTSGVEF